MTDKKRIALEVSHVSKSFHLPTEQASGIKQAFINRMRGIKGYTEQQVLRDISFTVEEGDFFGIVGRNGSGKSTLLKLISQIYVPDTGKIVVNGKLVPFIELGVGFNPELTGRENVYLNGALLGFSHEEVSAMYEEIVEFAELHDFMDQKLKNYSSGMQVRLAFSIAIKAQGDILVLDEVLAVGDEAFQRKCEEYFQKLKKRKKTVILVTHSMESINKYCNKAMMIDEGNLSIIGSPEDVSNMYKLKNLQGVLKGDDKDENREGNSPIKNLKITLMSPEIINQNDSIIFKISYDLSSNIPTYIDMSIEDVDSKTLIINNSTFDTVQQGDGHYIAQYSSALPRLINDRAIRIYASIFTDNGIKLAYTPVDESPTLLIRRTDLTDVVDKRSKIGLLKREGVWKITTPGDKQ